jgi:hypothetical protein
MKEEKEGKKNSKEKGIPKFTPWEFVNYSLQIENYYVIVRHLNNMGMNPRIDITSQHVIKLDIDEVFGPLKQPRYNNTTYSCFLTPKNTL